MEKLSVRLDDKEKRFAREVNMNPALVAALKARRADKPSQKRTHHLAPRKPQTIAEMVAGKIADDVIAEAEADTGLPLKRIPLSRIMGRLNDHCSGRVVSTREVLAEVCRRQNAAIYEPAT